MKYLTKKDVEKLEERGIDYAQCLKDLELDDYDSIELWLVEHYDCLVRNNYLPEFDDVGYFLYVTMAGVGQFVNCHTQDLVVACEKFNTVLKTLKS
jgi:hypothetical protein